MSMCRVFSCVVGRGCLLWPVCSLGRILLAFALLHSVLQGQMTVSPGICWLPTFAFQSPTMKRTSFWGVRRTVQLFSFFSIPGRGIDLDYCDIEWFALKTNRNYSVIYEIASKYCISDYFFYYHGYSISSKGFLPTVVDIMVIWVKLACSCSF